MRVCLAAPLTESSSFGGAPDPPVGILTLAAILRGCGDEVLFFDATRERRGAAHTSSAFARRFASQLLEDKPDCVGLGSICSSYPLTLLIAAELKRQHPTIPVVLGGPQAGATALETLEMCPAVDFIVRGEAEQSFPELLRAMRTGNVPEMAGITRRVAGAAVSGPEAPPIADLDSVPTPAFDLYFGRGERVPVLPLEIGRGCPYGCTFCSTNDFFRRRFRLKTTTRLMEEIQSLRAAWGTEGFDLVHDMFTVDRRRVVEFCEAFEKLPAPVRWYCSARTDRVDEELLERMRAAGCGGVFFGVESGSGKIQRIIQKKLPLEGARRSVLKAAATGMKVTASLICGFPEEDEDDLSETVQFMLSCAADENVTLQLHLLAPLAGTPLTRLFAKRLVPADEKSDITAGESMGEEELAMVRAHPEVFSSFYALPSLVPREKAAHIRALVLCAFPKMRWLLCALAANGVHWVRFTEEWMEWSARQHRTLNRVYYMGAEFPDDLVAFVETTQLAARPELADFIWMEKQISELSAELPARGEREEKPQLTMKTAPRLEAHAALRLAPTDFGVTARLWRENGVARVAKSEPAWLAFRRGMEGEALSIVHLPELTAQVARLCDGKTSTAQIAAVMGEADSRSAEEALAITAAALVELHRAALVSLA